MIEERHNNATLPNGVEYTRFNYNVEHLFIERGLPYYFALTKSKLKRVRDVRVWSNDNLDGAKELVETIKAYALSGEETWTPEQLAKIEGTQTLFIVYDNKYDMFLFYSKEQLTLEELEAEYPDSGKIFYSHNISDIGLVTLVDELLNWMDSEEANEINLRANIV